MIIKVRIAWIIKVFTINVFVKFQVPNLIIASTIDSMLVFGSLKIRNNHFYQPKKFKVSSIERGI